MNPYDPSSAANQTSKEKTGHRPYRKAVLICKVALLGTVISILASIPLAGITGLVFRFPIPFHGYMSGPPAFVAGMWAAVFMGIAGGYWLTIGLCGAVFSLLPRFVFGDGRNARLASHVLPVVGELIWCLYIATFAPF